MEQQFKQMRDEREQDQDAIRNLRAEKLNSDDILWKERNSRKVLENEIQDLRLKLKEQLSKNSELQSIKTVLGHSKNELEKLSQIEIEYQKCQSYNKDLEDDLRNQSIQIQDLENQHIDDQNKMISLEKELQKYQLYSKELQNENKDQKLLIQDFEQQLNKRQKDRFGQDQLIQKYDQSLKEIESQFDKREKEFENLKQQNQSLKDQLMMSKDGFGKYELMQVQYDEEIQKRKIVEREFEQLKNEIQQSKADYNQELSMLKRTIDDMRYQCEEYIKSIHTKDEEIRYLQKDINAWKESLDKSGDEITQLKQIITEVEDKNRKLNEKINEVIYNKASAYKQKTLQALKRGDSPERKEKVQEYGISNKSDKRLEQAIQDDKISKLKQLDRLSRENSNSPSKQKNYYHYDPTTNFKAFQELQRIENSTYINGQQAQSPFVTNNNMNDLLGNSGYDDQEGLKREDLSSNSICGFDNNYNRSLIIENDLVKPQDNQYQIKLIPFHQKYSSINNSLQNQSPLRQRKDESQVQNDSISIKAQTPQRQNTSAFQNYSDKVKNSCEKLASVLGIQQQNLQPPLSKYQYNNDQNKSCYLNDDTTQKSATVMTSSMIKNSLHELRMRLESMKSDKAVVENGINEFEQKINK